jgi:hypothetical protein
MRLRPILFLLASSVIAFGQVTPNSVTVTATRNTNIPPDQVVFAVTVDAPVTATREDVLSALDGSTINASNFTGVRTAQVVDQTGRQTTIAVEWSFTLTAPITGMKSTIGLLTAIQSNIAKKNNGLSMSFSVQGTQISQQAQQSQSCSLVDLVGTARSQAQVLAVAAGASLGSILAVTGATTVAPVENPFVQGGISPVCSITVRFALGGGF